MALFVAKPRPVTVKAVDSVETLFVPRTAFMKLAKQFPDMAARAAQRIRQDVVGYLGAVDKAGRRIAK
jgi:CRP-like cAMP-binding protein